MPGQHGARPLRKIPLPAAAAAVFNRMRAGMGRAPMAELLGFSVVIIEQLEHDGRAQPKTVERMVAALESVAA